MFFLGLLKQLLLTLIRNHFGSISQENNPAGADTIPTGSVQVHLIVVWGFLKLIEPVETTPRATEFSCCLVSQQGWEKAMGFSRDLPYSGGAQGPSPFATRSAIWLYHSSLVLPFKRPTTTMVMLSHPTPPVSQFAERQLFIMFSQI